MSANEAFARTAGFGKLAIDLGGKAPAFPPRTTYPGEIWRVGGNQIENNVAETLEAHERSARYSCPGLPGWFPHERKRLERMPIIEEGASRIRVCI